MTELAAQGMVLYGPNTSPTQIEISATFPSGPGQAGLIFGYKNGGDYWTRVLDTASNTVKTYHYTSSGGKATRTQVASFSQTVTVASNLTIKRWDTATSAFDKTELVENLAPPICRPSRLGGSGRLASIRMDISKRSKPIPMPKNLQNPVSPSISSIVAATPTLYLNLQSLKISP